MDRRREIRILPVCEPAETIQELRFQIDVLLEQFERASLKAQLREIHNGEG